MPPKAKDHSPIVPTGRRRAGMGLPAPRPAPTPGQSPRPKAKKSAAKTRREKSAAGLHALILAGAAVALAAYLLNAPEKPVAAAVQPQKLPPVTRVSVPPEPAPPRAAVAPIETAPTNTADELPAWRRYAATAPTTDGPRLAIVIDDLGLDRTAARAVADLPPPLTLAFLPYAKNLPSQTLNARLKGHELLVHMPMEPGDGHGRVIDPGRNALLTNLGDKELMTRLRWNLDRFSGYVGINNHMGSRFTADAAEMTPVLRELKARGLLFLDSRTTTASVGGRLAGELGVPHVARNVFLDNARDKAAIRRQLDLAERLAREKGAAVAIGHPYPETIAALRDYLPAALARGVALTPISALVQTPPTTIAAR